MMGIRFYQSLHFKTATAVILTVISISSLYFIWDYRFHREQLMAELLKSTNETTNVTLLGLLEVAMVDRHPALLQKAVERIGANSSMAHIFLVDTSSVIRFSSQREDIGQLLSLEEEGCRDCDASDASRYSRSVFLERSGVQLLRHVTPVPNREECHSCHDPSQRYNGLLVVDFPTTGIQTQLRASLNEMLLKAGLATMAILLVVGFIMNKLVIIKVRKLTRATDLLAQGRKDPTLEDLQGSDELGQLARSFDTMAADVSSSFQELQSQKTYLQDVINSLKDALIVVNRSSQVEMTNNTANQRWNSGELNHMLGEDSPLHAIRQTVQQTFETGDPARTEVEVSNEADKTFLECCCSPVWNQENRVVRVIVLFRDVTERRLFEMQVNRAERLASIGQLAAGLAHEINNPMAAITISMEGLGRHVERSDKIHPDEREEIREYLSTIGTAASRCQKITQRLLSASSHDGTTEFEPVNLDQQVEGVVSLLRHEAQRRGIQISTSLDSPALLVGDPAQLSQLILNLVLNGMEATTGKGRIHLSLARQNGSLKLEISDNGDGIPEEHLERVFDPFFTTKKNGQGTGLGLSISERIVRHHRGLMNITSKPGEGTQFSILFPRMSSGSE
ncbi:MAG: ATP-binding protein [Acidobacteriota bacterium]